jgi:hypothetical protein
MVRARRFPRNNRWFVVAGTLGVLTEGREGIKEKGMIPSFFVSLALFC